MKRWAWIALGVVALAQLAQPDRSVRPADPANDLIALTSPDPDIERMLRGSCYDCHSNTASYPWYSYVTPVNFWLQHHVDEGREEFNMSEWGARKTKWQRHKAKESAELLEAGEMPVASYMWMHPEADLDAAQRAVLVSWFSILARNTGGDGPSQP